MIEWPKIGEGDETELREGMVFSMHPHAISQDGQACLYMAIEHARDVYTRRQEGVSLWVVRSADIVASDPEEADALFEPARDKVYRHPTFYAIPEEVKNL